VARNDLPSGTVTFLFTDIQGSTKLLHELGPAGYAGALAEHRRVMREAFARHGGVEVDTQGDAFFIAFPTATGAVDAAREAQAALASGPIVVRMGIHTGTPHVTEEGYVGADVNKGARIASAAHGGQVVISKETRELLTLEVSDLGEHRVKDFAEPVWIYQLGTERFPPLKSISNTNLPRPASSFVGREREVSEVAALLQNGARLLTLTGPGGSGKTRLAIEAAAELVPEFPNGVFWVGLAPLRDASLVPDTIAQTLGAKEGLSDYLANRQLLLLLDNFEQVVDAGSQLATLVESCPNIRLLITSRELLRVRGEFEYAVPALADPEAVELFCARSQLQPDDAIAELCRRLENLPLAVELAAARTSVLSPTQILERLSDRLDLLKGGRDAESRQKTLRATIEWSHDLLDGPEKLLFARLSIFRDGCTLEAAQEVARADLDTLQSLVDKSLVRHRDDRFWMLETIREFAVERLDESGDAEELGRRHTGFFVALAEEAAEQDLRWKPGDWLDRLEREHDNLRATLDRLEASGDSELFLTLASAIWRFWQLRDHRSEARRRLDRALGWSGGSRTKARARALIGASVMAVEEGNAEAGRVLAEEALAIFTELGDEWWVAFSVCMLGGAATEAGDRAAEERYFMESIERFLAVGDENYALLARTNLAATYDEVGDRDRARALVEENLRTARALGNLEMEETTLGTLARYSLEEGGVHDAVPRLREYVTLMRRLNNTLEIAIGLRLISKAFAQLGSGRAAAMMIAASEFMRNEMGFNRSWFGEPKEDELKPIRDLLDEVAFHEAWEAGTKLTPEAALSLAEDALGSE
jgi:predicted ATPase